jgi:peptidoglycan hydrolase-like protein with peptidoglycan-binding domain
MPVPLIMFLDGLCRRDQVASAPENVLPNTDELISIDEPVGQGFKAKNLDGDVRTIQESLNKIKKGAGGPAVPLDVDGKCGPKTKKAIVDFQLKQFGIKGADGVIEPGKQTIQRINQLLFSNLPVDPSVNQEIKTKLVSHLDIVRRSIHAATTTLLLALSPSGGLDLGRGTANTRVDHHFALNTLSENRRDQAIRDVLGVFNLYSSVLLMPGSLGAGAFEADPTGDPRIAFTFSNGFFHKGEIEPKRNIPLDRIFLGRRAFFALTDGEFCAFIMLHEMAHFVGFPGGSFIGDNGRGWFTDDTIKKLTADQRLHNADSYATFAVECRTGDSSKPAYVKASNTSR